MEKASREIVFVETANLSEDIFSKERQELSDALTILRRVKNNLLCWLKDSVKDRVHINPSWLQT
ncbi:MAG: hypothetical protein LBV17_12210 [Treponema sp.]|nr:hypothetical protein [Treponema sp.]